MKKKINLNRYILLVGAEVLIFIIITVFMFIKINSYRVVNSKIQSKIEKYENIKAEVEKFQMTKSLFENKQVFVTDIIEGNYTIYNILTEIERIIPNNLKIENFNISKERLTIMVLANKEENIAQFIYNLQNLELIKNISINGTSNFEGQIRTTITAEIVRK